MRGPSSAAIIFLLTLPGCSTPDPASDLSAYGASYVKLALALDRRDPGFVATYFGPAEWRVEAEASTLSLVEIRSQAKFLSSEISRFAPIIHADSIRQALMRLQVHALLSRVDLLEGHGRTFDEESLGFYGIHPLTEGEADSMSRVRLLEDAIPKSEGTLRDRFRAVREVVTVGSTQVAPVIEIALKACRAATRSHIDLPDGESVEIRYVRGRQWPAFSEYRGNYHSLLSINLDYALPLDEVLHLVCHETYPGHHTFNVLTDRDLVREQGWLEHSVLPMYSPRSLLSEAMAEFGTELVFPFGERSRIEREELAPLLVGDLDDILAAHSALVRARPALTHEDGLVLDILRSYLDGRVDRPTAAVRLEEGTVSVDASSTLGFGSRYRSHLITYPLGRCMMREFMAKTLNRTRDIPQAWELFQSLAVSPAWTHRFLSQETACGVSLPS